MPRLRHEVTGVVVVVDEATAANLDDKWAPFDEFAEEVLEAKPEDLEAKPTKARRTLK